MNCHLLFAASLYVGLTVHKLECLKKKVEITENWKAGTLISYGDVTSDMN